jgi:hypothetical protein
MFGLTLEQWSYAGTVISAVAAALLMAFGVYQLVKLRRQVILGKESVEAALRAADAAQDAVRETARVRIDDQAPRVIALAEPPQWPPHVDRTRTHMPFANEPRMLDAATFHGSAEAGKEEFNFPEQEQWFMWFITRGILINEGKTTARVRLDGEARFIEGESSLLPGQKVPCPPSIGSFHGPEYIAREHVLRPGEVALFEWAAGHQLKAWAEKHDQSQPPACVLTVTVFDSTEHGVIDRIKIELGARPLEPVPRRQGHWRLSGHPATGVTVWPTSREYRNEHLLVPNDEQRQPPVP